VIGNSGIRNSNLWNEDSEEEDSRRRPRQNQEPREKEPVPNPKGQELMFEGTFGNNERRVSKVAQDKTLARRILERELGGYGYGREKVETSLMKQDLIPNSTADTVISYDSRCYCGQFSFDGSFYFTSGRDMTVRLYDTSNPYRWKYHKSIQSTNGGWHITDASLSNDNKYIAYCSMSPTVSFASTDPNDDTPARALDFSRHDGRGTWMGRGYRIGYIFSVRFSGDGREIVGGAGDGGIYVFDVERNASVLKIEGHTDDVNAVCFGDQNSPHILYSGSDDTTIKVWDRRSIAGGRPAGVFLGHAEGVTYVDTKGDGVYVISNCKDQTAKLWDIRMIHSAEKVDGLNLSAYSQDWDYRSGHYPMRGWSKHPYDCSLVTFRGHSVEKTLIRCHFSPPGSTDGRYIYSGSRDGKVYIWNLDATLKGTLDVAGSSTFLRRRPQNFERTWDGSERHETIVRDVSWHPNAPVIAGKTLEDAHQTITDFKCSFCLEWMGLRCWCGHCP
jgi:WD repeat-containing protein 23